MKKDKQVVMAITVYESNKETLRYIKEKDDLTWDQVIVKLLNAYEKQEVK